MYLLERNVADSGNWIPLAVAENAETLKGWNTYVESSLWVTTDIPERQVGYLNNKVQFRISWISRVYA
jgi:hypothetical protein